MPISLFPLKKSPVPFIFILIFYSSYSFAQLSVASGETVIVASGETLSVDGLGLTTNAGLDLSGISITKTTSLTHSSLNPSISRAYLFTPGAPSFSGIINFTYADAELNGITESNLQLNYFTTIWNPAVTNTLNTTTNDLTTASLAIQPIELTLANALQPLPVKWLDVSGNLENSTVKVSWQTADETQVENYTVMYSTNGQDWSALGSLSPRNSQTNIYQYIHINPAVGRNFYRIMETDLSGGFSYSKVVTVNLSANDQVMHLYPNPSPEKNNVILELGNESIIRIWQINGVLISSAQLSAGTHILDASKMKKGIYLISNGVQTIKWIIQ
ncbi:MAG: T9SS type A sorting domain-containing protein [Bacteroidetes bacterium]|nr:T9SS type A sorting domain-containing protein [Bacteroidota bacterium]